MKILILGGMGAMGRPLTEYLSDNIENDIYVVCRHPKTFYAKNVTFILGDAFSKEFLAQTLKQGFDVIVDFLVWKPEVLNNRLEMIFTHCKQYITMSSSTIYAGVGVLDETSPRLIDSYDEQEKTQVYRYHIKKSLCEDVIFNAPYKHWTLIRPAATFGIRKLKLLAYHKSVWLWRYVRGQSIVIPKNILDKRVTITYGGDVARALEKLVGNKKALGEVINVASDCPTTYRELLQLLQMLLPTIYGKELRIKYIAEASEIWKNIPDQYDALKKDRELDRCYSIEKLTRICGEKIEFGDLRENLKICLKELLSNPEKNLGNPKPDFNGWMDRIAHERAPLSNYSNKKDMLKYIIFRSVVLSWAYRIYRYLKNDKYRYIYK